MKHGKEHYRAIFLSDTHLGTLGCQAEQLLLFLQSTESDYLYLIGDIVDIWRLRQSWYWPQSHSDVVQELVNKPRQNTKVIYVPGNHDDSVRSQARRKLGDIKILKRAVHVCTDGRRLLITHGDEFDALLCRHKWLGLLGTRALSWLLVLKRAKRSISKCLRSWSLSSRITATGKEFPTALSKFEHLAVEEAQSLGFDGVICGHTHKPKIDGTAYYNDGDWVTNCSALVEHYDGTFELLYFPKMG